RQGAGGRIPDARGEAGGPRGARARDRGVDAGVAVALSGTAVSSFLDDRIAAGDGERVAIETPDARVTYAQLVDLANRMGNALREMGVEPEQRVALLLSDGIDWAATFFGALRIGAVA